MTAVYKTSIASKTPTDSKTSYKDQSSGRALTKLEATKGEISGQALHRAVTDGTKDLDNQAAGKEYQDFKRFTEKNWDRMSPNAKEKYRVYEKYAQASKMKGKTGIPTSEYQKMQKEMSAAGYHDKSAGVAIESLKEKSAPISGDEMQRALIRGTKDYDAQAAGKEYKDFSKFASENQHRMTPGAKAKFAVYDKYAQASKEAGRTGIPHSEYQKMVGEMKLAGYQDKSSGKAIESLKSKNPKGEISGQEIQKTIIDGTKDSDGQAANKEYADLKKFSSENWHRMSPSAKEKVRVYDKYAKAAQKRGKKRYLAFRLCEDAKGNECGRLSGPNRRPSHRSAEVQKR